MFLLIVKEASIEDDPNDDSVQTSLPKSYLRAYKLLPIDPFSCIHGPTTKVDALDTIDSQLSGKRKGPPTKNDPTSKRIKAPAYFLREVAQVVAMCDHIYPLAHVGYELQQLGVRTGNIQVEEGGVGLVLRLIDLPSSADISSSTLKTLTKHLLSGSLRTTVMLKFNSPQYYMSNKSLVMEYVFTNCPLTSLSPRETGNRRPVIFTYETPTPDSVQKTVQAILSDWISISKLYELVLVFAKYYNHSVDPSTGGSSLNFLNGVGSGLKILSEIVKIRSYNYRSITLSYGPSYDAYVIVKYNVEKKKFILNFGMTGTGVWATNAHTLLGPQLEELLNMHGETSLVQISFLLHYTYHPLLALSKLQPTLHPGAIDKCHHPIQIFTVIASSPTRVRIFYRNIYCLEVDFLPNGLVSIRDGAFSSFQMSRAIEEFTPIKGLKAFLSKYVDESAIQ
ncbi:hypothetical protein Anas_09210 [Armadillidium nasatum]|uniref:Uncharacterized protein n=1 Tax=Armadillidium nasatum TaxID=96803 RepID=A0A5N5TF48_9CRUS|nr:hypothetical protein Anas_09210 [Armadillidium nasatum]